MRKLLLWSPPLFFLVILATLLLVKFGWPGHDSASLKISNRSAAEMSEIRVTIHDTPCLIKRLAPGASASCKLAIESDSHFSISWIESGTRTYTEQAGYVTPGFDYVYQLDFLGEGKIGFDLEQSG